MNIHEYQGKAILREYGIKTPFGVVLEDLNDFDREIDKIKTPICVVKAQIHSGGRGLAGGVKLAKTKEEARAYSEEILHSTLVTAQTGEEGKLVNKILIEEGSNIDKEYYLSFLLDRENKGTMLIYSKEGGSDIEAVAEESEDSIFVETIDYITGITDFQGRRVAQRLGIDKSLVGEFISILRKLYLIYLEKDATMVEINPLITTKEGEVLALDVKMNFDENALYRQEDIGLLRDLTEEDEKEVEADKYGLSYISLDGNIGCVVNGAGLAMATMDVVKHYGMEPANFLDVGGSATEENVTQAFKIILSDQRVEAIFVNIFGGIMKCDTIARGIINAAGELGINEPLVVRLEGTNSDLGREIISKSGLNVYGVEDMDQGGRKLQELLSKEG